MWNPEILQVSYVAASYQYLDIQVQHCIEGWNFQATIIYAANSVEQRRTL